MKKQLLLFILLVLSFCAKAQDPHFSQYYNQPVFVNPAFAGLSGHFRAGLIYQKLYFKIPTGYATYNASFEAQVPKVGGIGLNLISDIEGSGYLRTNAAEAIYSYAIHPDPRHKSNIIQVGFKAGLYSQSLDYSKLVFKDQLDPIAGLVVPSAISNANLSNLSNQHYFADFSVGVLGRYNQLRKHSSKIIATHLIAFAISHITQPQQSLLKHDGQLPAKFSLQYTCTKPLYPGNVHKTRDLMAFGFILQKQDYFQELMFGGNLQRQAVYGGLWFRERSSILFNKNIHALVMTMGTEISEGEYTYKIGYSYDVVMNKLGNAAPGSHELSVSMISNHWKNKQQRYQPRKIDCYYF